MFQKYTEKDKTLEEIKKLQDVSFCKEHGSLACDEIQCSFVMEMNESNQILIMDKQEKKVENLLPEAKPNIPISALE